MQAALQQQLVAAQRPEFGDFRKIILKRQRIRLFRLVRPAVEIAKLASRQADIGIIDVPVDLVTDPPPRHMREPRLLRPLAEFPERCIAIERQSFVIPEVFHQDANIVKKTGIPKNPVCKSRQFQHRGLENDGSVSREC